MKESVFVLHSTDVKKALPRVANKPFAWLYLGQDMKQRENICQVLGKENQYFIGDLLQKIAHKEKQPFLDFMAELGHYQRNKLHWWASITAYRNPLASNLFLLWCYIAVFHEVCSQSRRGKEKPFLVFVEDRWLYRYLWKRNKENDSGLSFPSRKSVIPELLKHVAKGVALRGYFLLMVGKQIWQTKGINTKNQASNLETGGSEIYIYSWIENRFFREDGGFEDAYLGRLPQLLSSNGLNVVYFVPLLIRAALKSRCLSYSKFRFIFLDRYITVWSLLRSLFSVFSISFVSSASLKILLLREIACEFSSLSFTQNILQYFVFKKCLKEIRRRKIIIIYPFENQPWDKMLCLAAKALDKEIRLVGYQHSTVPPLLLNYFLGAGESSNMPLPHFIVTNGEYTLNLLKNAGYGETEIVNGGAFRYEYLHKRGRSSTKQEKEVRTVLVALPYLRSLTEEMLLAIFNAFKDLAKEKIRFMIKFHPDVPLERLKIQLPCWPTHFEKSEKPVSKILEEVDLAIYSSSTVGLEALLDGVPVVRYCSGHVVDLDPLGVFDEGVVKKCSENSIKQVILSALDEEISRMAQESTLGVDTLNRFFTPVNEDVWKQIVTV